jgi:RNA polymerase sigma factor (sigma-70 family)
MHDNTVLNDRQRRLVEQNLSIVDWVLLDHIKVNEAIVGLGREDLRQEGYIWLCHAAATYDGASASFSTYARRVVRNGLISHCRKISRRPAPLPLLPSDPFEDEPSGPGYAPQVRDEVDKMIDQIDTIALLHRVKQKYTGVTQLGIEALELKVRGLDSLDIAAVYGVKDNLVRVWISRAVQKLRQDEQFLLCCRELG